MDNQEVSPLSNAFQGHIQPVTLALSHQMILILTVVTLPQEPYGCQVILIRQPVNFLPFFFFLQTNIEML